MKESHLFFTLLLLFVPFTLHFQAHAAPAGPLIKHLSSLLKWTRSSTKTPQSDGNVLQFESGYLVETVVEGNDIGVVPYKIRVSEDGELFAVDEVNSNIVKITPPLSQYSRGRLVAGSFQGYTGHVDGKASDARFNHPKGVTMDDKGNVYVADTMNLAIRKIRDAGVTTIAGGKSNVAGYRDGPSEDAQFSNDFDVVYVRPSCSLLVIDRGNAALRQIPLNQEDCDYQYSSVSPTDILMVLGAILLGYATCLLQQGFGPSFFRKMQPSDTECKERSSKEKPTPIVETLKEEPGWPSFGQLVFDLSKLVLEAMASMFLYFVPSRFQSKGSKKYLTPVEDSLRMLEDEAPPSFVQRQTTPAPVSETRQMHSTNTSDKYSEMKSLKIKSISFREPSLSGKHRSSKRQECAEFYGPGEVPPNDKNMPEDEAPPSLVQRQTTPASVSETRQIHSTNTSDKYSDMKSLKIKSISFREPSLSGKHRSSKRQEYAEFYGPGEVPSYSRSKTHKERTRHRHRDKTGEVVFGTVGTDQKPVEPKPVDYNNSKFDHYNMRSKYGSSDSFRF